jgi:hypothetical protein
VIHETLTNSIEQNTQQKKGKKKKQTQRTQVLARRAKPKVTKSISTGAQYVTPNRTVYCKKVKMSQIAQEIGFSAPNSCSSPWLVKGAREVCTSKKE